MTKLPGRLIPILTLLFVIARSIGEIVKFRVISRRINTKSKRKSFQTYYLKYHIPNTNKWNIEKIKAISGKNTGVELHEIFDNNITIVNDPTEIANIFWECFSCNSSTNNYCQVFREIKYQSENENNVTQDTNNNKYDNTTYNSDILQEELAEALQNSNDSSVGPADIILQNLPIGNNHLLKI